MSYLKDDERKKWLGSLKAGDKVAVDYASFGRRPSWHILTVKNVTKTRNRFDLVESDGREQSVGKEGYFARNSAWRTIGIHPVTDQVRADIAWTNTSYKLGSLETKVRQKQKELTTEQMQRLIAVYEEVLGEEAQKQDQGE